jgi:two-component system sensor histidine kinase DegS
VSSIRNLCTIAIWGVLLFCKTPLHSQNDFPVSEYLQLLLDVEYQKATQLTTASDENLLHQQARSLSEILYKSGQLPHLQLPLLGNKTPRETKIINLLQFGYYNLYYQPNEPETLKYFFEAYGLSINVANEDFRKASLLAILEFYHFEYAQTHTRYKKYLREFETLAQTPVEKCWAQLYRLYFLYQSIAPVDEQLIKEVIRNIEEELLNLPSDHNFFVLYNSIKGVQLESDGDLEEALKKHTFVLEFSKNKPYLNYLAFRSIIRISEIFYKKEEYQKGLDAMKEAPFFIDKSNTLKDGIYINKYTSKHYEALGDYKKAYELLNKSVEEQYKLDYKNNNIQNSSLEIELQTAEKEKQLLISEDIKKRNQNIAIGLGLMLILGSLIAILINKNTKRKQRIAEQERELEVQKTEKILKEQELTTIDAMISGQEKERQRLASDLHDSVGATLAAAKLQFHHLSKNRDKSSQTDELFTKTGRLLEDAYNEIRSMAHVKNSGVIAKNGLLPAVQKLAESASGINGLYIEVEDFGLEERLENSLEITVFRIIQELVTNIIKHSQATEASIAINQYEDSLNIIVEDNGIGFDARKVKKNDSMGLTSLEKRIEHIEGTLEIDTTLGKGTTILIDIPL